MLPSTIKPIVEKIVLPCHTVAADPDATIFKVGAESGGAICQFQQAFAKPVSDAEPMFACVKAKVNWLAFAEVITAVTFSAPLPFVVWLITTVCPTTKLFIAVMVATLLVSAVFVIAEKLLLREDRNHTLRSGS